MDCRQVLDIVEAVAAGDVAVAVELRAHLESCPTCAAALASARRIDGLLQRREAPAAPARFTSTVVQRVRRERWSAEQRVDRLFNVAIVLGALIVAAGIATLLNLSGVLAGAANVWIAMTAATHTAAREAASAAVTYVAAGGLLLSALGMWWWAERRLSL